MKSRVIVFIVLMFFLVGCDNKKYIDCNINVENNIENYKLIGKYQIYYKKNYVVSIKKHETYYSKNSYIIDYFDESKKLEYYNFEDKYGGITYSLKKSKTQLDIYANINFKDVDVSKIKKENYIDSDYIAGSKILLSGIKMKYESMGAVCSE